MPELELSQLHLQEDGAREEGLIACYVRIVNSLGPNAAILVSFHAKKYQVPLHAKVSLLQPKA